jgi:hypothetical protein
LPAGVYDGQITSADVTHPDGKDERIELVVEVINNKDHNGKKLYEYVNLESKAAKWKLLELLEAVGVNDKTGTLDTQRQLVGKKIGIKTFVRPADDAKGFDESARIRRMFAMDGASADGAGAKEDLSEDEEPSAEASAEGDEYTWDYLETLDRAGLKQVIKDESLSVRVLRSMSDQELLNAVGMALELPMDTEGASDEEEEDEEEVEVQGGLDWSELEGMDRSALKVLNKERELGVRVLKSMSDDDLRAAVAEALNITVPSAPAEDEEEEAEEETEAEAPAQPTDDYDEWSEDDLREELGERNLPTRGSKKLLISRLRKDDSEEDRPF